MPKLRAALILLAMFGPAIIAYVPLRRAGRTVAGALWGSLLIWAICMGVLTGVFYLADHAGVPFDYLVWAYPIAVVALFYIALRKPRLGG